MKKIIKQFVIAILLVNIALTAHISIANAQGTPCPPTPLDESTTPVTSPLQRIQTIGGCEQSEGGTGLNNFLQGQHPDAPPDYLQPGVGTITSPVFFAIDLFRFAMSSIAMLVIIVQALKLISTQSDEEAGKAKNTITLAVIGFVVIQAADIIVNRIFFGEQGEAFEDIATGQLFAEEGVSQIRGIIGLVEAFLGAVAVLVLIVRGFTLMVSAGDEEAISKAKRHVIYATVGLFIIGISELVVRGFIFPEAGTELPSVDRGRRIIVTIVNFISGFIALFAFLSLFYAGYRYVMSAGNEEETEKVKKTIFGSVVAIVLALGSFAIVNTLVDFEPELFADQNPEAADSEQNSEASPVPPGGQIENP